MSYPRLVQKYGKQYSWKMMLNPRSNINERSHAVIGECNSKARETYVKGWKRTLAKRVRPTRLQPYRAAIPSVENTMEKHFSPQEPGSSMSGPEHFALKQKIANCLSKIRTPQLTEFIKVGAVIGSGVEGVVRPGCENTTFTSSDVSKVQCEKFKEIAAKFKKFRDAEDGEESIFAVKTVDKLCSSYGFSTAQDYREAKVMNKLSSTPHPNITNYVHTFESPIRLHIVTEYNQGGDLFTFLQDHDFERQSEKDSARVMMQLFCAALYTQEKGYAHLDLKLENVMRRKEGDLLDEGGVCLIDFGHASLCPANGEKKRLHRPVGSPSYAAPEVVLDKVYSQKTDCWSLGVMMYILVQGYLPFPHLQQKRWREFSINDYGNFDKGIQENDPFYYTGDWEDLSSEAKGLCQGLLQVDAEKRLSLEEAINHPWFEKAGVTMVRDDEGLPIAVANDATESAEESSG